MKKRILLAAVVIVMVALNVVPIMARECPCRPVCINKTLICNTGPGFSSNPPYYVGVKYYWFMEISVHAYADLSSVVVYDRLGAELMIEGIFTSIEESDRYGPWEDKYDYDFDYLPYERNGQVWINDVHEGNLDKTGVNFDNFTIMWTGNSVKVHFMWEIGAMEAGETETIWLVVSTDTNPAGHQEYTSPGCYALNSGATVKAILARTGRQFSAETPSIWIRVLPCVC